MAQLLFHITVPVGVGGLSRYEVESGGAREAAHTKLLEAFYERAPVLVNAVYMCFLENATDGLNVNHVLSNPPAPPAQSLVPASLSSRQNACS